MAFVTTSPPRAGFAVIALESDELVYVGLAGGVGHGVSVGHFLGLHLPAEFQVGGEDACSGCCAENGVNYLAMGLCGHTDIGSSCIALAVEVAEESFGYTGAVAAEGILEGHELALYVLKVVYFVKLEIGRCLEQVAYTIVLFNARKFKKNLSVLFKLLDVGGNHAKLVDTVAEHVGGRVHAVLYLLLYCCFDLVGALAALGHVFEHYGHVGARLHLLVLFEECRYIVAGLGALHYRVGCSEYTVECLVVFGIGDRAQNVGHAYLEDYVHTSFQVEAEAYAHLLYLIECIAEYRVHLLFSD